MNSLQTLLEFLNEIERCKISYRIEHNRDEALMVLIAVPGERWEVEFFADGRIEFESFSDSSGVRATTANELLGRLIPHSS